MNKIRITKLLVVFVVVTTVLYFAFQIVSRRTTGFFGLINRKTTISGVEINDVVKNKSANFDRPYVEEGFEINYFPKEEVFSITILSPNFEGTKTQAERKLLDLLGINESDACKLNVIIGTPHFVNPTKSVQDYYLSFCN